MKINFIVDPDWTPEVGQILVVAVDRYYVNSHYPFVRVTNYKKGQKSFKVEPVDGFASHNTCMFALPGQTPSEIKYTSIRPALVGDSPTEIETFVDQTDKTEYTGKFSRKRGNEGWKINLPSYYEQRLATYDPQHEYRPHLGCSYI